jgi:hypothetical protein
VELALLAGGPLGIDEESEAFFEAQSAVLAGAKLLLEGLDKAGELHDGEFLESRLGQHWFSSFAA